MKTDKQNTACAITVRCTVKFCMLKFGFIDPPKENTTVVEKPCHAINTVCRCSWQEAGKGRRNTLRNLEKAWQSDMKQWVLRWQDEGCSKLQDVRALLFYIALWKAMMLAVFFMLVFIVCTIRASQVGNRETLQSQQCGKNEKNPVLSTLCCQLCNPEWFYLVCLFPSEVFSHWSWTSLFLR